MSRSLLDSHVLTAKADVTGSELLDLLHRHMDGMRASDLFQALSDRYSERSIRRALQSAIDAGSIQLGNGMRLVAPQREDAA